MMRFSAGLLLPVFFLVGCGSAVDRATSRMPDLAVAAPLPAAVRSPHERGVKFQSDRHVSFGNSLSVDLGDHGGKEIMSFRASPLDVIVSTVAEQVLRTPVVFVPPSSGSYPVVDLEFARGLHATQVYELIRVVASAHGYGLEKVAGALRLASAGRAGETVRVVKVRHRMPSTLATLSQRGGAPDSLKDGGVQVVAVDAAQTVVISGETGLVDRTVRVVEELDQPSLTGWTVDVVKGVEAREAGLIVKRVVGDALVTAPWGSRQLLLAGPGETVARARQVLGLLADWELRSTVRYETVSLDPGRCADIVSGRGGSGMSAPQPMIDLGGTAPGLDAGGGTESGVAAVPALSGSAVSVVAASVIAVDGACVVHGDAVAVVEALERLRLADTQPALVEVEGALFEATIGEGLRYGVRGLLDAALGARGEQNMNNTAQAMQLGLGDIAAAVDRSGFTALVTSMSVKAIIEAVQHETGVRVLATPTLWLDMGERGVLQVGDQVPTVDKVTTGETVGGRVTSQVTYRDVGVILRVQPQRRGGGRIRLKIGAEVSDAVRTTTSAIDSPTISRRGVETTVTCIPGQTVMLGGLYREGRQRQHDGLPWLSGVPLLGDLIGNTNRSVTVTELVLLVTPRVIDEALVAAAVRRRVQAIAERS